MNIKKYFLRFAVTITAFFLGFAAYSGSQYVRSYFQTAPVVYAAEAPITVAADPAAETLIPMIDLNADVVSSNAYYSNLTGEYYLSHENLPREFKDIEYVEVVTHVYDEMTDDADDPWKPVPATGSLHSKRGYKFETVSVSPVFLVFETEAINGISYRFVGHFRAPNESSEDHENAGDLKGKLQKLKNGVETHSMQAAFYFPGC